MDSLRRKIEMKNQTATQRERLDFSSEKKPIANELFISPQEAGKISGKYEQKFQRREKIKRIWLSLLGILLFLTIAYLGYFGWKTISVAKKMQSAEPTNLAQNVRALALPLKPADFNSLRGAGLGRINILLLGAAGEKNAGRDLTDTVMVMSIDVKNKKVALLSLPRDLYVNIPDTQTFTKINSVYKIGLAQDLGAGPIKKTVEKITNLSINYYLIVNFDGFVKIIDDIGGINIISERDFLDTRYPGPNYSYETFSLSKGFHTLDGATALKYVRERHSDPEGDFGRAKRQQQVIQAVKSKLFSMETFFNVGKLNDILNTLGDNIKTDIPLEDLGSFIALSKQVDTQNINNVVVDAWKPDSLLKVSHVAVGEVMAFILVPRVGNFSEIQDLAQSIFDQSELKKRREAILAEDTNITIFNQSGNRQLVNKIKTMLTENLGLKNVQISSDPKLGTIEKTVAQDNANGAKLFTLDELLKKLPATLATEQYADENSKADLVIILGQDLLENYKFETDSIEDYNKAQDSQANLDFTSESESQNWI